MTERTPVLTRPGPDVDFVYPRVPAGIDCRAPPELPVYVRQLVLDVLNWLINALEGYGGDMESYPCLSLDSLAADDRQLLDQLLGEGRVSARVALAEPEWRLDIQESVFTGVWRLVEKDGQGNAQTDWLAVCPIPATVWRDAHGHGRLPKLPPATAEMTNGLFIAHDILARCQQPPCEPHIINLSLLPVNQEDKAFLDVFLGEGESTVYSRGYGKCRVVSTRLPAVWRIQYFNEMNTLVQDRIEICRIPAIVLAAPGDLADSRMRLREVYSWLSREGTWPR